MSGDGALAVYRFAIEDLYRQQEHVLDDKGEQLLSLSSRFSSSPNDAYAALSTADVKHPVVRLSDGVDVTLTYGQYRAILATNRNQADRAASFSAFHTVYEQARQHLRVAVQRRAAARLVPRAGPRLRLDARRGAARQQHSDRGRREPDRRDEGGDRAAAPLSSAPQARARPRDATTRTTRRFRWWTSIGSIPYDDVLEWLPASVAPLGAEYQRQMREVLGGQCIDVYENPGKRSGAYSAPVYGCQPYMLLNYNDTLDAVFTLAHEMGHSMHTVLSHAHQPFVYAGYTIFVAEVPSTLSEALFLDYMLARATDERERIVLLQHAIDGIVGTFYTQVMFADYELQAHRLVEEGKPVTADVLSEIYFGLLQAYHGDALDYDAQSRVTWARIPHFYSTPYYVYQYATCFASSAQLMKQMTSGSRQPAAPPAVERYLTLLKSGGSDHPMTLLQKAGVDLSKPETVRAVVDQLDTLVTQLERALDGLKA